MALSIKNRDVDHLVRELCAVTGESITSAIEVALRERLERVRRDRTQSIVAGLETLAAEVARLEVTDDRSPDDLLYDAEGLPG